MPEGRSMAFLNPLDKIAFQIAIRNRRAEFPTKSGMTLSLNYEQKPGSVWYENKASIVPCGWLNVDDILSPAWLRS